MNIVPIKYSPSFLIIVTLFFKTVLIALCEGCRIHGLFWKFGIESELCFESALMDMYSKCIRIEDAWKIFESVEELDEVSMTALLVGFAHNGFVEETIHIFGKIVKAGIEVDLELILLWVLVHKSTL